MAKHKIKSGLSLDGEYFAPGSTVELTAAQAEELHEIIDSVPTVDTDEGDTAPNLKKLNKDAIIKLLEEKNLEFDPNAKKDDLIAILGAADAPQE